jgi:hypothetical protein
MGRICISTLALACLCLSTGCAVTGIALPGTAGRLLEADTTDEYVSAGCEVAKSIAAEADTLDREHSPDYPCDRSRWDRYARCGSD